MNAAIQFACRNSTRRISMQSARFRVILTPAFCQILPYYINSIRITFWTALIADKNKSYLILELFKLFLKMFWNLCYIFF